MRTLGVVGSLFSLMHTLVLFGSPFVMMADVWFGRESCVFTLLACLLLLLHPYAYVDIMLMHCNCIMLFYHGSAYLHSSLIGLN